MTITLYHNASDPRMVTKTITQITQYTNAQARGAFEVTGGDIIITESTDLTGANYCYIQETGRYYFIQKITASRNDVWVLSLAVDVLTSYAAQIRALTGTVDRQENLYNGYIQDGEYKALAYSKIVAKAFPNGMTSDSLILMTVG